MNEPRHNPLLEQKDVEQASGALEMPYKRLFETAQDGILILDGETGVVLEANPAIEKLLGYSPAEFAGKKLEEIASFQNERAKINLAGLQQEGGLREALLLESRTGKRLEVEFISVPYLAGQRQFIQCNIRDVTQRKAAELGALQLAAIVDSSDDAIIGKDLASVITSWNKGAERIFGYTAAEMVGSSIMRLIPADRHEEELLIIGRIKRGESLKHFETLRQTKAGRLINISVTVSPIKDACGKILGVSKVARDISETKRAQERSAWLATFPERSPNPIFELDLSGSVFHYLNAAAARQFPDLESQGPRHPLLADLEQIAARLVETGTFQRDVIIGESCLSQVWTYIADARRVRVYATDITERRNAELALRAKEAELYGADRRLAEIVQGMTEACFALDTEWRFTFVNERTEALLRHQSKEMLGRPIWDVFKKLKGTPMEAHYRRAMAERVPVTFEVFSPIAERWLDIRLFPTAEGLAAFLLDVDDRKQAESAVRESEDRFRTMANSMPQLAWIAQADGSIFWYNERWYEYTGTTLEQMEGWGWQSVHDPAVLPTVMENWKAALDSGQRFEMEFPLRGADGRFRNFLTQVQPLKNPEGGVVQWFGTNTDVDELKRMEESLRATQARLNSTLSAGSIGTWTWDIPNDRLTGDEFTARAFSIEAEAAADGLPAAAYLQAVVEEDQPSVSEGLSQAIATCGKYDIEYRVRLRDGAILWLQARGRVEGDAAGNAAYFHGAVMDITARKLAEAAIRGSEAHFRFLNDLAEAARKVADPAQLMAEMARMLGEHLRASRCAYADVEEDGERFTISHDFTDGCASTVGQYALSLFGSRAAATLRAGQTLVVRNVEAELSPEDGAEMFKSIGIQAVIVCSLIKQGGLRAMMAVHQTVPRDWQPGDIAMVQDTAERCWSNIKRKNAEERVRQLNAELEQRVIERTEQLESANKELEAFSYSVSHDLRAPLRAVDGFSQAVLEDYGAQLPEEGLGYLKTIREGAQKMGMLIDDLLAFSRLSRMPIHRQKVIAENQVREALIELNASRRAVEIRIGALEDYDGDPALMKQVWLNLLSNALKYTGKRTGAVVEIGSARENGRAVYFVRDNGTGFDMRYANKLFGVFQRLHRQEEFEGTGVGLAIVQRIVHRHGGRIWADAAPDRGATFYFTLCGETEL